MKFAVSDGDAILRLLLAAGLGFVVGLERQLRTDNAGPRTFALLALGAAAFSVLSIGVVADGRIIAGIATGVGFIGAGMIFHDSSRGIVGFATAAASWATVAMGVLVGMDRPVLALAMGGLMLVVLELEYLPFLPSRDARRARFRHLHDDARSDDTGEGNPS